MKPNQRLTQLSKFILLGLFIAASAVTARAAGLFGPVIVEEAPGARREVRADEPNQRPDISFIDSPGATCERAAPNTGQCSIQWTYLNVAASSSQYMISMTVEIDGRLRAYYTGFFQTSMYIPFDLQDGGFLVTCGKPDVNGWGQTYAYTLRARETGGLSAANYGSVTCPGDVAQIFIPLIRRN